MFDLPEPRLEVTEHRATVYRCHHCRGDTTAAFPKAVTAHVQYGPCLRATAVYLNVQQLIPKDRVCEAVADLLAAPSLCAASVAAWTGRTAEPRAAVVAHIAASVVLARVRHLDETGFRVGGKTRWLHTASTVAYTHYRIGEQRGDVPQTMADGIIVHDHFKVYYALSGARHALCNAHHLRELWALIEIEKEPGAEVMRELLRAARTGGAVRCLWRRPTSSVSRWPTIPRSPRGLPCTKIRPHLCERPASAAGRRIGQVTICCSACAHAKPTCCASRAAIAGGGRQGHHRVEVAFQPPAASAAVGFSQMMPLARRHEGAQQRGFHARGEDGLARIEGELAVAQSMGQADRPIGGIALLGAVKVGYPKRRTMARHHLADHTCAAVVADDVDRHLVVLKNPVPEGAAINPDAGLARANHAGVAAEGSSGVANGRAAEGRRKRTRTRRP